MMTAPQDSGARPAASPDPTSEASLRILAVQLDAMAEGVPLKWGVLGFMLATAVWLSVLQDRVSTPDGGQTASVLRSDEGEYKIYAGLMSRVFGFAVFVVPFTWLAYSQGSGRKGEMKLEAARVLHHLKRASPPPQMEKASSGDPATTP